MKKAVKLVALLSVMGLIYYFSSQPSYDSTITTNSVVKVIYDVYSCLFKNAYSYDAFCDYFFQPIRKLAHFSEFGLLGLISYINSKEYFEKNHVLYSLAFSALYATSDEIHQIFVYGRYCSFIDVLIDTCGALCAILLIHIINKKCLKK